MKKLAIVLLIILLSGCGSTSHLGKKSPGQIIKLFDEGKNFIVYVAQDNCETCNEFEPVVKEVIEKHKVSIYYIMYVENEDMNFLLNNYLGEIYATPMIYLIYKGKVLSSYEGYLSYDEMVEWLTEYGYIE